MSTYSIFGITLNYVPYFKQVTKNCQPIFDFY